MNKIYIFVMVFLLFVLTTSFSEEGEEVRNTFLENYFKDSLFEISDQLTINDDDAFLAVTYANKERRIVNRAIVFSVENGLFRIYLFIEKNKIQNTNGEILFTTDLNAYGWDIRVYPRIVYFELDFFSNDGIYVTDGPSIEWNQNETKFGRVKIDTSQY